MSCPICGRAGAAAYRPFCSRRCADIDLAKWLGGGYRVPSRREDAEEIAEALEQAVRAAEEGGSDGGGRRH